MSTEAMKLALEALMRSRKAVSGDLDLAGCAYGKNDPDGHQYDDAKRALKTLDKAITALREALTQPQQQEPVAWVYSIGPAKAVSMNYVPGVRAIPLYTSPPAQRKPLTWERVLEIGLECANNHSRLPYEVKVARAIEAAHGIKGDA